MAQVETLMLANHAETLNGLLYVHGGGWSHHWRGLPVPGQPPTTSQFAIAATFLMEPSEAASRQPFTIRITAEDGHEVMHADGMLEGRPSGEITETAIRSAVALNANLPFPGEGTYTLTAEIAGSGGSAVVFQVHDGPPSAAAGGTQSEPEPGPSTTGGYL